MKQTKRQFHLALGLTGHKSQTLILVPALFALYVGSNVHASEDYLIVNGATSTTTSLHQQLPDLVFQPDQASAYKLELPDLAPSEELKMRPERRSGPQKIGAHREIPLNAQGDLIEEMRWTSFESGVVGYATIRSPGAKSIRVEMELNLPPNAMILFFEIDEDGDRTGFDAIKTKRTEISEKYWWSPPARGEVIGIEVRLASRKDVQSSTISLLRLAHRTRVAVEGDIPAYELECTNHTDSQCAVDDGDLDESSAKSTVKLEFEDGEYTYVCSGMLMNVEDGEGIFKPYILTAAHCIADDAAASSVVVHWFYRKGLCGGNSTDVDYTVTYGGAELLQTRSREDMTLLELNRSAPDGARYAGWWTSNVSYGVHVHGAHHPGGEHKKYFQGSSLGSDTIEVCDSEDETDCFTLTDGIAVRFVAGAPEGGSSGAGMWQVHPEDGEARLVGILSASDQECNRPYVWFGRLQNFYPFIEEWFDPEIDDTQDDHGNTTATATLVTIGSVIEGEIDDSDDIDMFEISISQSGELKVHTQGSLDTVGWILGEDGNEIATDDDSGIGLNFSMSVEVDAGTYFVKIESYGSNTGEYELHTEFIAGDDHGNDAATATTISCSANSWNLDTPGVIDVESDVDVFELELLRSSVVTMHTEGETDTIGELKNDQDSSLERNDDRSETDANFRITRELSKGTYYLYIEGRATDPSKYRLNVEVAVD